MLNTEKMAFSIDEAAKLTDSNRDRIYAALKSKDLKAKRHGRRTLILRHDLEAYLKALPDIDPGKGLKQPEALRRARSEARTA